jgi:hypothetical protein
MHPDSNLSERCVTAKYELWGRSKFRGSGNLFCKAGETFDSGRGGGGSIQLPTSHNFKLLMEAYATLEEPGMEGAERILAEMQQSGIEIEAAHHSVMIHDKGCVFHDVDGAIEYFNDIVNTGRPRPDATLYQALFEVLVGNYRVAETDQGVQHMRRHDVTMTPYIANPRLDACYIGYSVTIPSMEAEEDRERVFKVVSVSLPNGAFPLENRGPCTLTVDGRYRMVE